MEPCPTCEGQTRETTDMVCETCGRNYGQVPLSIDYLLANACPNPEDWQESYRVGPENYKGWYLYVIELHCLHFEVYARPLGEGKYEVREYIVKDG